MRAVVGVPVVADGRPIGVLAVYRIGRDEPLTVHDLNILTVIGRQIGLTIERIRHYQAATQEAERRIALFNASQQIGAILDLPHLLPGYSSGSSIAHSLRFLRAIPGRSRQ